MDQSKNESTRIVAQLLEATVNPDSETIVAWSSGRTLLLSTDTNAASDSLVICSPTGSVELRLEFRSDGPRLIVPGGELQVKSERLAFQADSMKFDVKTDVNWEVRGDFNVHSKATNLISSDDVAVNGRFIKLNCDQIPTEVSSDTATQEKEKDS